MLLVVTRYLPFALGIAALMVTIACADEQEPASPGEAPVAERVLTSSEIQVEVLAGAGEMLSHGWAAEPGYQDGPAAEALFDRPTDIAAAPDGTLYIADFGNRRIRAVTPEGEVITVAGDGQDGVDDGSSEQASFRAPVGLALDGGGGLIVVDSVASNIRRIDLDTGTVVTIAGQDMLHCTQSTKGEPLDEPGCPGTGESQHRDGEAASAWFHQPTAVAVGTDGIVYIVDSGNWRIRELRDGVVTTLAGTGMLAHSDGPGNSATFRGPTDIALGAGGLLYITDGTTIRAISAAGMVSTVAGDPGQAFGGHQDGAADAALFLGLGGIAMGQTGLCIGDSQYVRAIQDGVVYTLAGNGEVGFHTGSGDQAQFALVTGLAALPDGRLAVADHNLNRIMVLSWAGGALCD